MSSFKRHKERIAAGARRFGRGVVELSEERIFKGSRNVRKGISRVGKELREIGFKDTPAKLKSYRRQLGPGLISGAADDDAGGILTYSIIGATLGYALLWLMVLSTPMLIAIQSVCARLGNVTHKGLGVLIRERWGTQVVTCIAFLVVLGNVGTIAADLAGMGVAAQLLTGIQWFWFILPFSAIMVYVLIFKNFKWIERTLIGLSFFLLAYVVAGFMAEPNWGQVLYNTVVPHMRFDSSFLFAAIALLGTTITSYVMFYQTSTEVEAHRTTKDLKKSMFDTVAGMLYSNLVSYFIIITSAVWFFSHGINITTAEQAALALRPLAGDYSYYLFAIGLFGASTLAVFVIAASTAYTVGSAFNWPHCGLNQPFKRAKKFYYAIAATVAGGILILALGVSPIDSMIYSQFFLGVILPVLVYMVMRLVNDEKVVGQFKPSWSTNVFGWFTMVVSLLLVVLLAKNWLFP